VTDATRAAANLDPSDPSTPGAPETAAGPTLGDTLGIEDSPAGAILAEEGAPSPDLVIAVLPKQLAAAVENGTLSLAAAAAKTPVFETCLLSFRRNLKKVSDYDYDANFGARFSCNVVMPHMKFRSRVVFTHHDSQPIAYGNLIDKSKVKNEISHKTITFPFDPSLVVYVSGDLAFPPPSDPNNYAVAVAYDFKSVNGDKSHCKRKGKTFTVECHARSLSFTH
jgi:pullulanase/glycogen debranching enzyme